MVYIVPIVCLVICALCIWGVTKLFDKDRDYLAILAGVMAVIMGIAGIGFTVNAITYIDYKANEVARIDWRAEERIVLTTMLNEISGLMENDVTASQTYMDIYQNVIKFNRNVREANVWSGTIWEGVFCDPSYAELSVIELN